jgi:DNA transformation protein
MKPFQPRAKQTLKNYYEVPADILEDDEQCVTWATQAAAIGSAQQR